MNSLLQSSLYGHDFVKYRQNNSQNEREKFSHSVRTKGIGELPVVIDSVEQSLSELLAGLESKRFNRNGKEFRFHTELLIEDILFEVRHRLKLDDTKVIKLGLENGKMLDNKDVLGDLFKKHKNQSDHILYLLLTQESTMYGYIMSLLRYIFGPNFMKI
jgi:hypothetical protein